MGAVDAWKLRRMFLLSLFLLIVRHQAKATTPIVTWHGVGGVSGDCDQMISTIKATLPDVHVFNVAIGQPEIIDGINGVLMPCVDQIDWVCEKLKADPLMADGYNAIGISQGGLLIRGLVQRCPIPVKNLITFGAPHQGVFGVPDCAQVTGSFELCELVNELLSAGAYEPWVQDAVAPAQYWHDPLNLTNYVHGSHYLAIVNNEVEEKESVYKERMVQLDNFVMMRWEAEATVVPAESSHFGFFAPGQVETVQSLQESQLYQEDFIGLKTLDEAGKLTFHKIPGGHMTFDYNWIAENIVPFLED